MAPANPLPASFPHGGGVLAAARAWGCAPEAVLDLSTGLHPDGPPPWLAAWLQAHAHLAGHYPDGDGEPGRSALATALGVAPAHVLITAGAQALIEVVFQAMGWRSLAIQVPCYAEPIRCARRAGCSILSFGEGETPPPAEALWWTSPANPSGAVAAFPADRGGVLDESYMRFAERRQLGLLPGVLRVGSLTKTFSIPGLRLGYLVAEERVVQRIREWLPPWPAPTMALHLLPSLLAEADARDHAVAVARERLAQLLVRHGWQVRPSLASFVLAKPGDGMPDFAAHRILVRTFPEWPQLAGWVRFGLPGSQMQWQCLEELLCR